MKSCVKTFYYNGSVKHFEEIIVQKFEGYTEAISPQQALNRFAYRAKVKFGFSRNTKLTLNPNNLKIIEIGGK